MDPTCIGVADGRKVKRDLKIAPIEITLLVTFIGAFLSIVFSSFILLA